MAAHVHATNTYDVPAKDDTDADTYDDDDGPCEDRIVLAKTHSGASEDTYCESDDNDVDSGYPVRSSKVKVKVLGLERFQKYEIVS